MRWSGVIGAIARCKSRSTVCARKDRSAPAWHWICGVKPRPKAVNKPSPHSIMYGLDKPGVFTTVSKISRYRPCLRPLLRQPAWTRSLLAQRGGIDRGRHGLHGGEDFLGKEAQALFGLVPGHAAVEHVHHEHFQAEGMLQRGDLGDDLVRGAEGLGGATGGKARIGDTDIGSLALEV